MSRIACPDCGGDLGPKATKCRCGWKSVQTALQESRPNFTACAGNADCRFPGRLWVRTLAVNERLCINHYYRALEDDPSLGRDDVVPPRMAGVSAKPVAGE